MGKHVLMLDCDGVILNSNSIKTEIFKIIAEKYSENANHFIDYHKSNGGVSRYEKFDYFLKNYCNNCNIDIKDLLREFSSELIPKYLVSEVNQELKNIHLYGYDEIYVVSGSDQDELRIVMNNLGISEIFDRIYGSPVKKSEHIKNILNRGSSNDSYYFIGDSYQDYLACSSFTNVDFFLFDKWSECTQIDRIRNIVSIVNDLNVIKR